MYGERGKEADPISAIKGEIGGRKVVAVEPE